jgi:hypothetical protein
MMLDDIIFNLKLTFLIFLIWVAVYLIWIIMLLITGDINARPGNFTSTY